VLGQERFADEMVLRRGGVTRMTYAFAGGRDDDVGGEGGGNILEGGHSDEGYRCTDLKPSPGK
jgi:hypothetical protein